MRKPIIITTTIAVILMLNASAQRPLLAADDDFDAVKEAAEQGDVVAQVWLGTMYTLGEGVPEDDAEAAHWFRQAAEQGDALAQRNLGFMYAKGEGVPEDDIQAYAWISLCRRTRQGECHKCKGNAYCKNVSAQRLQRRRNFHANTGKPLVPAASRISNAARLLSLFFFSSPDRTRSTRCSDSIPASRTGLQDGLLIVSVSGKMGNRRSCNSLTT